MTKYRRKYSFRATDPFKCTTRYEFCLSKRFIGAVLSISENLRSKGQRPSSPHDQIWAKLQFWIHNCIQMNQLATCVNRIDLLGQYLVFLKNWIPYVKCQGHQVTKYGHIPVSGILSYKFILIYQVPIVFKQNDLLGQC